MDLMLRKTSPTVDCHQSQDHNWLQAEGEEIAVNFVRVLCQVAYREICFLKHFPGLGVIAPQRPISVCRRISSVAMNAWSSLCTSYTRVFCHTSYHHFLLHTCTYFPPEKCSMLCKTSCLRSSPCQQSFLVKI